MSGYSGVGTSGYSGMPGIASASGYSGFSGPSGGAPGYYTTFTNASLPSGVLTINHNLGQKYNVVQVFNSNDQQILPDNVTVTGDNTCYVDLTSYGSITGTWGVIVSNGNGASGYSGYSGKSGYSGFSGMGVSYRGTFVNSNVSSSGIFYIDHNLNLAAPYGMIVQLWDSDSYLVWPDSVRGTQNSLAITLSSYLPLPSGTTGAPGVWGYSYIG